MSDDVDIERELDLCEPSDLWIESLIRGLRGLSSGDPISPRLFASFKRSLRKELRRHLAARRAKCDPGPPPREWSGPAASPPPYDVVWDMILSPEGQAAIALIIAMPALSMHVAEACSKIVYKVLHTSPKHEAAPVYGYLISKVGGRPWSPTWGRRGPMVIGLDGRSRRQPSPNHVGVSSFMRAAINAVSPRRAIEWRDRLDSGSDGEILRVLEEIESLARPACAAAAPIKIWYPEPGEPRGLLPDPPPPDADDDAEERPPRSGAVPVPPVRR